MSVYSFFFFNDTATTEIYTLSLHDALPILTIRSSGRIENVISVLGSKRVHNCRPSRINPFQYEGSIVDGTVHEKPLDRKSTRLNSSHSQISYAVFCLKKKKAHTHTR